MSESFSLTDLAGVDMGQVEAVRFETLPDGAYTFKVVNAGLKSTGEGENMKHLAEITCEVVDVIALNDDRDPESLIGKKHQEAVFIKADDLATSLGRVRAMLQDMGFQSEGPLGGVPTEGKVGLLDALAENEHVFNARIKTRKDPRDSSRIFANLKFEKGANEPAEAA